MRLNMLNMFVLSILILSVGCGGEDKEESESTDNNTGEDSKVTEGMNPGECSDGADNDSDGEYDCNDSDCAGAPDCQEETDSETDTNTETNTETNTNTDTNTETDTGDEQPTFDCSSGDCLYNDIQSQLQWQGCLAGQTGSECSGSSDNMAFDTAINYCENLEWASMTDWRLPNIDELRTLIRGCEVTSSSDSCDITHECSPNLEDLPACSTAQCIGCTESQGPGNGCYMPSEFPGEECAVSLWSSSKYTENLSYYLWTGAAHLDAADKTYSYKIRCIRDL